MFRRNFLAIPVGLAITPPKQLLEEFTPLTVDWIEQVGDEMLPPDNKQGEEDYDALLVDLKRNQVHTVGDLRRLIASNLKGALETDRIYSSSPILSGDKRRKRGVFFKHVGLIRQCLDDYNPDLIIAGRTSRR